MPSNTSRWATFRGLCIEDAYYPVHTACTSGCGTGISLWKSTGFVSGGTLRISER